MARVLTVYGTFATGAETGDAWWQLGGPCTEHIKQLVEGEDGALEIEPVIWGGLNSEIDRQRAAEKLLERMSSCDKAGQKYCVVGHSHGGSVISNALLAAAYEANDLQNLSRWISVGTPFVLSSATPTRFFRLGQLGKLIVLTVVATLLAFVLFLWPANKFWADRGGLIALFGLASFVNDTEAVPKWVQVGCLAIVALGLLYGLMWLLTRNTLFWHSPSVRKAARSTFGDRWVSLRHPDDEAVQGLGALRTFHQSIFRSDFLVAPISGLAILLVPLATYCSAVPLYYRIGTFLGRDGIETDLTDPKVIGLLILVLVVVAALAYVAIALISVPISSAVASVLNATARSQLRSSGLGSDENGETGSYAQAWPAWLDRSHPTLPPPLADEIKGVSDQAGAKTLAKYRAALGELDLDRLNVSLGNDDLIHCTYFLVPRFRKLLAYAIAQSPGFRPSAMLSTDPEFATIAQWYQDIMRGAPPG